LNEVIT